MFSKFQNKLYIGGCKSDLIWKNIKTLTNEKKINCLLNINNSKLGKNKNNGKRKTATTEISFCSICVDYGTLKYLAKNIPPDRDTEGRTEGEDREEGGEEEEGLNEMKKQKRNNFERRNENSILKLQQFKMGAIDQKGNIYIFDFERNTFNLITCSGISANCISFNPFNKKEIIVGHTNKSIRSYNIVSRKLAAILPTYHHSEPYAFSFHPVQPFLLSSSYKDVIIWDLNESSCIRVLKGIQDSELQNAIYSNTGQQIIASFINGNILIWNSETFDMEWKISLEALKNENISVVRELFPTNLENTSLLVISEDNTQLVYGGMNSTIFIWNINEKVLKYELNLTILHHSTIKRVEFVGNKKIIAILSNNGSLVFVDTNTGNLVAFRNELKCSSFTLSKDGEFIFLILNPKSKIVIYSTEKLINYQKPILESLKNKKGDENDKEKRLNTLRKDCMKKKAKEALNVIEIDANDTTQVRTLYETIDQYKVRYKIYKIK
ncbi:WD40-repeat-containing domain protein [Neocallimastix sp. 'constans']